jgi:hypothetical protein
MRREEPGRGRPLAPLDLRKIAPIEAAAVSDRLGWVGLEAARYCEAPAFEFNRPAITHHRLVLYTRPPEELYLMYEGVKRHLPPAAGAIALVPAGNPHRKKGDGSHFLGGGDKKGTEVIFLTEGTNAARNDSRPLFASESLMANLLVLRTTLETGFRSLLSRTTAGTALSFCSCGSVRHARQPASGIPIPGPQDPSTFRLIPAPRGHAGQPRTGLRTVSWGESEAWWSSANACTQGDVQGTPGKPESCAPRFASRRNGSSRINLKTLNCYVHSAESDTGPMIILVTQLWADYEDC